MDAETFTLWNPDEAIPRRVEVTSIRDEDEAQRFMIYAGGRAVAAATQASSTAPLVVSYLHDDALGSIESITAADASVIGGRHFDAFGDARGPIAAVAQAPYAFTGQEQDPELGLVNMHGRMYDPRLGQFMSPDPEIQSPFGQGLNRFAYVFNSPLNFIDPSGFTSEAAYWENGLALGVPFTAGLVATIWQSAGGGEAAVEGATRAAQFAPAVADTATSAAPSGPEGAAIGIHVLTSGVHAVMAAKNATQSQFRDKPPPTRAVHARSAAHGDTKNSAVSGRRESPPAPTPPQALSDGQKAMIDRLSQAPPGGGDLVPTPDSAEEKCPFNCHFRHENGEELKGPLGEGNRNVWRMADREAGSAKGTPQLSKEAGKSIRSLEQRLKEHQNKLDAFRKNPDAFDNKGFLKNAPSQEVRERIIQGRVNHLEQEIRNFQQQIERLRGGGG